jgi:hypothetical protein
VVKIRLASLIRAFLFQVEALQRDLHLTRMALCKQKFSACKCNACSGGGNGHAGIARHPGDEDYLTLRNGDAASGSSTAASETSSTWEAVDERETKPTLWMPDHAAVNCMG